MMTNAGLTGLSDIHCYFFLLCVPGPVPHTIRDRPRFFPMSYSNYALTREK